MKDTLEIKLSSRLTAWLTIIGFVLLALLLFYPLLAPNRCLFTTDDNLGIIPSMKNMMPRGFFSNWSDTALLGGGGGLVPIMWTSLFLWLMPAQLGFNWIHASELILASIALAMFLRAAGLHWMAIVLGVISAFWVGSNFTLTYAGHMGKFGALMFATASLYGIRQTFESDRPWLWSVVTGGLIGFMFLEAQDVALFFGLFWGAYTLFRTLILFRHGSRFKGLLLLIPMVAMILIMSGATLMASYAQNVSSITAQQEDNPRQKWEFTTQWSWPPEESIDFVAPGYMGWRSSEADGPYWGRMGRSSGWEKTGQGFMNFKLENQYLGAIPVIFALFAVLIVVLRSDFKSSFSPLPEDLQACQAENTIIDLKCAKMEILFWFFAAVLALLLSFGKYFPLYQLFYQLPVISNIRNPNKFLQVFQLAVGILAAYGAHFIFNWHEESTKGQRRIGTKSDVSDM